MYVYWIKYQNMWIYLRIETTNKYSSIKGKLAFSVFKMLSWLHVMNFQFLLIFSDQHLTATWKKTWRYFPSEKSLSNDNPIHFIQPFHLTKEKKADQKNPGATCTQKQGLKPSTTSPRWKIIIVSWQKSSNKQQGGRGWIPLYPTSLQSQPTCLALRQASGIPFDALLRFCCSLGCAVGSPSKAFKIGIQYIDMIDRVELMEKIGTNKK